MRKIDISDITYFLQGITKKRARCPYCGNIPTLYAKKYHVIEICKCSDCGLFFLNPMYVSRRGVATFYNESYDSYKTYATYMPDVNELKLLKKGEFAGKLTKDYDKNERLKIIRKLTRGRRLLEFGSSWGYFLFQAQAYDFIPVGIEISPKRGQFGRLHLDVDIFTDIDSVSGEFDVIYSAHVLEHLLSLKDIFDKFYSKLLPGGSLIIEVPNFDPETKGKSIYSIIGKVHPLGFCRNFFEKNLQRHGFSEIVIAGRYDDLLLMPSKINPIGDNIIVHAKKSLQGRR